MNYKHCRYCYYYNVCPMNEVCEDYSPITDEANDAVIEEMIEKRREEYRTEWFEYMNKCGE